MPLLWGRHGKQPKPAAAWLCALVGLCCLLFFCSSATAAASVQPTVAISNLDTQVYVYDAPVGVMVSFWFNATDCTDVDNALVAGSLYVPAPTDEPEAATNTITIQFPSWSVNWPHDHLVVCARDAINRATPSLLNQQTGAETTLYPSRSRRRLSAPLEAEGAQEQIAQPARQGHVPEVAFLWPLVPLRDLLLKGRDSLATLADTVTFTALGEVDFYDLYHSPALHRLSPSSSAGVNVLESVFYVGLRQRLSTSTGEPTAVMMPSFCSSDVCDTAAPDTGRLLTSEEAAYVLSVLAKSVLYVYPTRIAPEDAAAEASEGCGALIHQGVPGANFTAAGQPVPTAEMTITVVTAPSSASLPEQRWRVTGTFTNLTSDQYASGLYPLCLSPAFIYLSATSATPPMLEWSSIQGEAMAGLTTLTPDMYTVHAASALISETKVLWDLSATVAISAASSTGWSSSSSSANGTSGTPYAIVVGGNATACAEGTVLFMGTLLEVPDDDLTRHTPRLRFGPSSVGSGDAVASLEDWAALFPNTLDGANPDVTLSVCLSVADSTTATAAADEPALTTWGGAIALHQLHTYATTVLLAAPAANLSQLVELDTHDDSLCAVPALDAFEASAAVTYFLSTAANCSGERFIAPTWTAAASSESGTGYLDYLEPQTGVAYVLCLSVVADGTTSGGEAAQEELTAAPSQRAIHFLAAPLVTEQPEEVFFDSPFTFTVQLDGAAEGTTVWAIPAGESCESSSCPPDTGYSPTRLSAASAVSALGEVTVMVPLSASEVVGGDDAAVRLCLSASADGADGVRDFSLLTVPISRLDDSTTTTTTTTTAVPTPVTGVFPTTVVKGQPAVLQSFGLQTGSANLAYDKSCNQFLFSPAVTIVAGRVALTVARCATADYAYYCERQGPSYPYVSTALIHIISLVNCTSNELVNLVPVSVPPATPVETFGITHNGTITNTTPFLSQVADCQSPPSAFAQGVQRDGYMTALGEVVQFYVCITSLDGTLNFTNTEHGPTLTIAPFDLDPEFAVLGVEVSAATQSPAVPTPDSTFVIRGLTGNGWNGVFVSNTAVTNANTAWPSTTWTPALCNASVADSSGAPRATWNTSALGRGEPQSWVADWGAEVAQPDVYYANMGPYYVCSARADALVPVTSFLTVAPPVVDWLATPAAGGYACARMLVPGGLYSLLPSRNNASTWSAGVYLMPTTTSEYAAAVAANRNLCELGPYTDDGEHLRDGYSAVGSMTSGLTDVVCIPTYNLTATSEEAESEESLYVVCSGTPAGYTQTNESTRLATQRISPTDLTAGATVTMTLPDWPSTRLTFTPVEAGCEAIPDGMPTFTTDEHGVGTTALVIISSSLGTPLRPLDEGTYILCYRATWQSPALVSASSSSASPSARASQGWVTKSAWAPLSTVKVYDAVFYDVSSHTIAVNVTSSIFLLQSLTADVLKPGFYVSPDCNEASAVSTEQMNWTLVPQDEPETGSQELEVIAHTLPVNSSGVAIDRVYLCALTKLNATYQPVPNNEGGIRVLENPFFFHPTVHPCEQLDVFLNDRRLIESTGSVTLVDGPCCVPRTSSVPARTVQSGVRLARFYRSFLLNETTLSAIAPATSLTVCANFYDAFSDDAAPSSAPCMTAGVVTVLTSESYCDSNPGLLPFLALAPRGNVYGTGVVPVFRHITWAVLIAIAVVAGVAVVFAVIAMIVCCARKRRPKKLTGEPDLTEALAQTPPMWRHVATPSTLAEAEATAERKRTQPERAAGLEKQVVDCLQSQLLPAMSPKEVSECLPLSLRGTLQSVHTTPTRPVRHTPQDASYDPVARYLGKTADNAASPRTDAAAAPAEAGGAPSPATAAASGAASSATPSAPTKGTDGGARRYVSAPTASVSPPVSAVKAVPATPLHEAETTPLRELEAQEAAARADLEESEDDALYHVLETERCRWRDLMAGEGVRLKTLLEQDPFWSSRLAMLESLNTRALERAAERSATRDRSESGAGPATENRFVNSEANGSAAALAGRGAGRAPLLPPLPGDGGEEDEDVFSAASGVMTPLSETVLVFPGASRDAPAGGGPKANGEAVGPLSGNAPAAPRPPAPAVDEADGLETMRSHVTEDDDDGTGELLDLDESLFSSMSGGGSDRVRRRPLPLLQTPQTSGPRGPPTALAPPSVPPSHRDPHVLLGEADESVFSELSGSDGAGAASHPTRWTPPPPPLRQQQQAAPWEELASEFSDQSAHASASRKAAAPRHAGPTTRVTNPLPAPPPHLWANTAPQGLPPPAVGPDETEGTASSGTGLLYSPRSGNRRMTVPRAAVSPTANAEAARALSWSPPSAMASVPREEATHPNGAPPPPAAGAATHARGHQKNGRYDDIYLDEL